MKKTIYTLSALALAFSMGAQANTAADVEVSGTIAPTPCTVVINNASIDFGSFIYTEIPETYFSSENDGSAIVFEEAFTINVDCSAGMTEVGFIAGTPNPILGNTEQIIPHVRYFTSDQVPNTDVGTFFFRIPPAHENKLLAQDLRLTRDMEFVSRGSNAFSNRLIANRWNNIPTFEFIQGHILVLENGSVSLPVNVNVALNKANIPSNDSITLSGTANFELIYL